MRVTVFFVCLCFLLAKGYDCIYTGTSHDRSVNTSAQLNEKAQPVKLTGSYQGYPLIRDASLYAKQESLIGDDEEDEDANSLPARKYRLLSQCCFTLSCPVILNHFHSRFKASQPFCGYLSYKYITQRVLRI